MDTNRKELVVGAKVHVCYLDMEMVENKEEIIPKISRVLNMKEDRLSEQMKAEGTILIKKNLRQQELEELEKLDIKGLYFRVENGRNYPKNEIGGHLFGFVNMDNDGVYGLEAEFNDVLSGIPGKEILSKSISGNRVSYRDNMIYQEIPGKNIVTTIDAGIQDILYERGKAAYDELKPKELCIIAMNPNNGDVLGMQSFPEFNPNNPRRFVRNFDEDAWKKLSDEEKNQAYFKLWKNVAVSDTYEPGSVFKLVTLSGALEEGTTDDSHIYVCDGFVHQLPQGVDIRCWSWNDPHGAQNISQALTNSCNPAFVQIARELGKEKLLSYVEGYGFGKPTGIRLLGESAGVVPKHWKP